MKAFFDLSFRYKIPLWGSFLIVVTALAVSSTLMIRAYGDLKDDLLTGSALLGRSMAKTLFLTVLQDDVWRTFDIVNAPLAQSGANNALRPETIVVLDNALKVVVSTQPKTMPMLTELRVLSAEYAALAGRIAEARSDDTQFIELPASHYLYVVTPIADEGRHLGTLVTIHSKDMILPRFWRAASGGGLVALLVLAVLVPINWYWGQRMARPVAQIAAQMDKINLNIPSDVEAALQGYPHKDEFGKLFDAYRRMLGELKKKEAMEQQMVQSERLAAVGRLAAGMAHEINNPLGGMLTAIDTLKSHGDTDPRAAKTVALIERGLTQIRETVSALLVEARTRSRDLESQDIEDVRSLVVPQAHKKVLRLDWSVSLAKPAQLQASLVRQIMINLLLNAIQAANQGGVVVCSIDADAGALRITVENDGKLLTPEQMTHLYEPFSPMSEDGHGLGLWVTYQIVQQLGGQITVDRDNDRMRFAVCLPYREST